MTQTPLPNLSWGRLESKVPMASLCSFRVGGLADWVIYPDSIDALVSVLNFAQTHPIQIKLWGNGTNLLPSDKPYSGLILKTNSLNQIHFTGHKCHALAGASLIACAYFAAKNGLSGLEFAYGIPATVGGAVVMNAGAYQAQIFDLIESIQVYRAGKIVELQPKDLHPGYRCTDFRHNDWSVLSVTFRLSPAPSSEIFARMEERKIRRRQTQPLTHPSAGSVFKNLDHISAWQAIDQCGLRGHRMGGAVVSEKHSNFILNVGKASAQDVRDLIEHIQRTVRSRMGLELHTEIEYFNF